MKHMLNAAAWTLVTLVILYAAIHPDAGVLYHNPLACLGVGLIGLGLYVNARRAHQRTAAAVQVRSRDTHR